MMGPAHRRAAQLAEQQAFIVFGGQADQFWLRLLRPGFRHCFAALSDAAGWTVLDPLTGRLVVARLDLPPGFDLPGFYRRAGLTVLGPFVPAGPCARRLPPLTPFSCVSLCRAVLGADAPFALTPFGLFQNINKKLYIGKMSLLWVWLRVKPLLPTGHLRPSVSSRSLPELPRAQSSQGPGPWAFWDFPFPEQPR